MNRRSFVQYLAALPALFFGHKALAATPANSTLWKDTTETCTCERIRGIENDGAVVEVVRSPTCEGHGDPKQLPKDERFYTDVEVMFADITMHTKSTGDIILSADNPSRFPPTMGFWAQPIGDGPGIGWSIPLPRLVRSLKALEEKPDPVSPEERMKLGGPTTASPRMKAELIRACFKTREGRVKLACAFPGQRSDEEHSEAQQRWLKEHAR